MNNSQPSHSQDRAQGRIGKPLPPPQRQTSGNLPNPSPFPSIKQMVKDACTRQASDIHIRVGQVPRFRIQGEMLVAEGYVKVTIEIFKAYLAEILTLAQRKQLAQTKELDTAIFYPGLVRCRVNCFDTLTGGAIVLRLITLHIPSIDELGLPIVLKEIVRRPQGFILITGSTGSGKSTTVAAMMRYLNENVYKHIITIEDPIQFVHPSYKSIVSQREVGLHTYHFHQALRSALREDPDVIVIEEMRDRITIETALQAAQSGHLVISTLHTKNAVNVVNRLLGFYNPEEQYPIKVQLLESLVAVVAQSLVRTVHDRRVAVHDVLINTPAIKDYLLKGEEDEVTRLMSEDLEGMQVMNKAIYEELAEGRISLEEAKKVSPDLVDLERRVRTGGVEGHSSARQWMMS